MSGITTVYLPVFEKVLINPKLKKLYFIPDLCIRNFPGYGRKEKLWAG